MTGRAAVVAVAVAVTLVGCGGSSGSSTASRSPSKAASPSPKQDVAADRAAGQAALLKLTGFPTGWTTKTSDQSSDSDKADKQIAKCLGISESELNSQGPTHVESPDFEDSDNHMVSSSVEYSPTVAALNAEWARAADPKVPGCLQTALATYFDDVIKHPKSEADKLPEGVTVGKPRVGQMSFPTIGDRTLVFRITVPMQAQGLSIDVYVDVVMASKGRAGTQLMFQSVLEPMDAAAEQKFTKLVVNRLTRTTDAEATQPV